MKVALSTPGKFHSFDLARELHAAGMLQAIFTSYPKFKLHDERIPAERLKSFPWIHVPYMALNKWGGGALCSTGSWNTSASGHWIAMWPVTRPNATCLSACRAQG